MIRLYVLAASLLVLSTPALAEEYYVAQDPSTKECGVVDAKPDGTTKVMVGKSYATKSEAYAAKNAATECVKPSRKK